MDEIVFQRETLRRALADLDGKLAKAAENYDPESDAPTYDAIAAANAAVSLYENVRRYSEAVMHRIESRKGSRHADD